MGGWQLVAGPSTGGYDMALTDAKSRRMSWRLTEAATLDFTIDGRSSNLAPGALQELTTDVHALWVSADGTSQPLGRWRVGPTGDDVEDTSHTTQVSGLSYRAILSSRRLYSYSTVTWSSTDIGEIAWGLIQQTQTRPGGDLGIVKGWTGTAPTGVIKDRTYTAGDSIGERIQELAETLPGFDWDIRPVSESALQFDVWSPRGMDRGVIAEYGGLVAKVRREVSVSDYANAIRQSGASGLTARELEAPDLSLRPEGRWDGVFGDDGLITQASLDDRAAYQLDAAQVIRPAYTLTLRAGAWSGPDHIWLGDPIRLIIQSGRLNIDTIQRVQQVDVALGEDGQETVEITLGAPRTDYRRRPALVEQRLTNLERR
ncbi:hypothetical protein EBO15_28295 [Actinomadura harenae]|uniref:Uncharacterized protein n=2 Tax=Actinomadura harenae TaxID=2483351 RepID=A0A3M2LSM9_9ACTN|nr:hypothetical protein EBO15_28295 [Actinomadura harenae]